LVGDGSVGDGYGGDGSGGDGLGRDGSGGDGLVRNRSAVDGSVVKKVEADPPSFNWFKCAVEMVHIRNYFPTYLGGVTTFEVYFWTFQAVR
jgi:hypothetical protein